VHVLLNASLAHSACAIAHKLNCDVCLVFVCVCVCVVAVGLIGYEDATEQWLPSGEIPAPLIRHFNELYDILDEVGDLPQTPAFTSTSTSTSSSPSATPASSASSASASASFTDRRRSPPKRKKKVLLDDDDDDDNNEGDASDEDSSDSGPSLLDQKLHLARELAAKASCLPRPWETPVFAKLIAWRSKMRKMGTVLYAHL